MVLGPQTQAVSLTVLVTLCSNLSYPLSCELLAGMRCVWCLGMPRPVSRVERDSGVSAASPAAGTAVGELRREGPGSDGLSWGMSNGCAGMLPRDPSQVFGMCQETPGLAG